MKHGNGPAGATEAGGQDGIQESLATIQEQGRQTLELVRSLIGLLLPKEGGREGPSLEELLAAILVHQRETLALVKANQAELERLGKTLPAAGAMAVGSNGSNARANRS